VTINSERGFATVLLMTLVPLVLAMGAAGFFTFAFLKEDLATLNVCRAEQLQVQDKVARIMMKLFRWNPRALRLRKQQARAEEELEAAIATGDVPEIAAANAKLIVIFGQRELLALDQKALIASANLALKAGNVHSAQLIRGEWQAHHRPLRSWLDGAIAMGPSTAPELAIVPDIPDTAPAYEPAADFENKQSWSQTWTVQFKVIGGFSHFLNYGGHFARSCTTSIYPERQKWIAKLKADDGKPGRFFSKAFF
jgi:hypothetical protein